MTKVSLTKADLKYFSKARHGQSPRDQTIEKQETRGCSRSLGCLLVEGKSCERMSPCVRAPHAVQTVSVLYIDLIVTAAKKHVTSAPRVQLLPSISWIGHRAHQSPSSPRLHVTLGRRARAGPHRDHVFTGSRSPR